MSEKEKKSKSADKAKKIEFEEFEEAFFNEGDFQTQEAETGNYMTEDFGTELWEDFELPLDTPTDIFDLSDMPPPKKVDEPMEASSVETSRPPDDELEDTFALDGFELEDEPVAEHVVVVEVDDFSLDELEDFDAADEDTSFVVEVNDFSLDDFSEKTVEEPVKIQVAEPVQIQVAQNEPTVDFIEEDFGVISLEEQDDFFEFENSMEELLDSPLIDQVQTVTSEAGIVVVEEDEDFSLGDDIALDDTIAVDDLSLGDDISLEDDDFALGDDVNISDDIDFEASADTGDDISLEDDIDLDDIPLEVPIGVSVSMGKPAAESKIDAVEEHPKAGALPVKKARKVKSLDGMVDILLEEASHTKEQHVYCEAARYAYTQGLSEEALDILMRVTDMDKSKDFYALQLQASYTCSDVRVFQNALHELLPLSAPQERCALWIMGAKLDIRLEEHNAAQKKLKQAVQEDSDNSYAHLLLLQNSRRLGNWDAYIQATKDLARLSPSHPSSILMHMAAEVALERMNDRDIALQLLQKSADHHGRTYKKLMTQLGWNHHESHEQPSSLLSLYGVLVNFAESKSSEGAHDLLRWVEILRLSPQERLAKLQEEQVFAQGVEQQILRLLLARNSTKEQIAELIQANPTYLLGLRASISSIGEAQQVLIQCDPEKHGSATRYAILQDLYRTQPSSQGAAKPKLGRSWLGVRRGRMALNPTEMTELFDFANSGVIQELWYIHLSMKKELESLYIKRASAASDPEWKAHWFYQAGLVQNKKECFEHARTLSTHIPVGFTREYIAAWKDWQFGEGNFLDCIELLEKQSKVCDIADYKVAVALLKGEDHEDAVRILSGTSAHINVKRSTDIMQRLTEHEKGWLSLILLFSNPSEEVFRLAFSHAPALPTDLLLALALTSFDIQSAELFTLLDAQMGTSKEEQELRLALLFASNDEKRVTQNIRNISADSLQEDCSILAEICGMWGIAKEYAEHPEEVFGGMHPNETRRVLEQRLLQQPSIDVALRLIHTCTDSTLAYQALLAEMRDTSAQYAMQAAFVDAQSKDSDVLIHLRELFDKKPLWNDHTQLLVRRLHEQKKSDELLQVAKLCPEAMDEVVLRLLSLSSWNEASTLMPQCIPGLVHDLRMESISRGLGHWLEHYNLLQKRMETCQSKALQVDAESKCAVIMLEHLANQDFTLKYYQAKAEEEPKNKEYLEALSRIAIAQGDIQRGIRTLETLYEQASQSSRAAQYLFRIGEALESDGRTLPAIEKLKLALDLYPPDQEIRQFLKKLLYKGKYTDNLITVLQQEIEISNGKQQYEAMKELAVLHEDILKKYDKAINIWAKIWHKDEKNLEALHKLIDLSKKLNNHKAAVRYMQELFSQQPSADLIMEIANRYQSLGEKSLFEDALLKATDFAGVRMTALLKLSEHYKSHQDSEKYSQTMLSIAEQTNKAEDKVRILEQILSENEQSIRSQDTLFQICSMIEKLDPNHERSIRFIAEYHYQAEAYDLAIPFFERVLAKHKEDDFSDFEGRMSYSDLLFRFANALRMENKKDHSIRVLKELLQLIPYHMQALRLIGPMLIEDGSLDEASQVYKSLLMNVGSESPEALPLYLELGDIEVARGDNDQAIQFFVRAFRMEPENTRVIYSLAQLCVKLKRWNKALQLYQKLLSTRKISKSITKEGMLVKAWILNKNLNLHDIAYKHLEQSLQYDSNQPIVLLCMAEMRYQKEEYTNAIALLDRMMILEEGPYNNLGLLLKSVCLHKEGREAESLAIQELLKIEPQEVEVQLKEGFSKPIY